MFWGNAPAPKAEPVVPNGDIVIITDIGSVTADTDKENVTEKVMVKVVITHRAKANSVVNTMIHMGDNRQIDPDDVPEIFDVMSDAITAAEEGRVYSKVVSKIKIESVRIRGKYRTKISEGTIQKSAVDAIYFSRDVAEPLKRLLIKGRDVAKWLEPRVDRIR